MKANGSQKLALVHPDAWIFLKSAYMSPVRRPFSVCYRMMKNVAVSSGWSPIPSESVLRRVLKTELGGQ